MATIQAKVQLNIKTAAEWSASPIILLEGEIGVEKDTLLMKVGNGSSTWNSLPYTKISSLTDILDLHLDSPQNKQVLQYLDGEWKNATLDALPSNIDLSDYDNTTSGFITASDLPEVPTKTSDLENDSNFVVDDSYTHTDNNFTSELKSKLESIPEDAEANVNANWNATVGDAVILNKPVIPTRTSELTNDSGYISTFSDIYMATLADVAIDSSIENGQILKYEDGIWKNNDAGYITTPLTTDLIPYDNGIVNLGDSLRYFNYCYVRNIFAKSIRCSGPVNIELTENSSLTIYRTIDLTYYSGHFTIKDNGDVELGSNRTNVILNVTPGKELRFAYANAIKLKLTSNELDVSTDLVTNQSIKFRPVGSSSATNQNIQCPSGTNNIVITANNNQYTFGPGTGGSVSGSDERIKKNIVSMPDGALDTLNKLRPVKFDFKHEESNESNHAGFIAQETDPIVPDLTVPPTSEDGNYGIDYAGFVPYLVKAVQELSAKVDKLENKLKELGISLE